MLPFWVILNTSSHLKTWSIIIVVIVLSIRYKWISWRLSSVASLSIHKILLLITAILAWLVVVIVLPSYPIILWNRYDRSRVLIDIFRSTISHIENSQLVKNIDGYKCWPFTLKHSNKRFFKVLLVNNFGEHIYMIRVKFLQNLLE